MVSVECQFCGSGFEVYPRSIARGAGKFCSRSCSAKSRTGDRNSRWRGGRIERSDGRVLVYAPEHPNATLMGGTHILEYRLVASNAVGRPLLDGEVVHHLNGDVTDNRPDNLQITNHRDHGALHSLDRKRNNRGQYL